VKGSEAKVHSQRRRCEMNKRIYHGKSTRGEDVGRKSEDLKG
jgi:hypothetical protein